MTFEDLKNRLDPKLKGIVYKLNGHFTYFDDEDLYQEALIHLWISWKEAGLDGNTDSYILQGCFYFLKNYIRTAIEKVVLISLEALVEEGDMTLEGLLSVDSSDQTLDSLDEGLLHDKLSRTDLTERERSIIDLTLDGLTTREIGLRLGVSHVRIVKIKKIIRIKCQALRRALPRF